MLTGKEFRKYIFSLIGEHPYTWAKGKGIKRHVIDQLKRDSIPGPKILDQLSIALEKDIGSLVSEKEEIDVIGRSVEKKKGLHGGTAENVLEGYSEQLEPEEEKYISKLMAILRGKNDAIKELITCFLDTVASTKEWIKAGRPERRKKRPSPACKGRHERRKRIHSY